MAGQVSGQITVTTAGTAVQGPNLQVNGYVQFVANPNNTDTVWVGNDGAGDVAATTGFPLLQTGNAVVRRVNNLLDLWFDADVNGEKICYILLD